MADEENEECPPCLQHVPGWMVTFADMASLLMTFFVLMLVMSPKGNPDSASTEEAIEAIKQSISGQMDGGQALSVGQLANMGFNFNNLPSDKKIKKDFEQLEGKIKEMFSNEIKARTVTIENTKDGFSITLMGDLYFPSGSSELSPQAKPTLEKIGDLIFNLQKSNVDNGVRIKGFADANSIRPNSLKYKNNLSLTSARSASVIEFFWNYGVSPTRIYKNQTLAKFHSIGYGEFQPLERNISPEERSYNRRVEIEFLNDPDAK